MPFTTAISAGRFLYTIPIPQQALRHRRQLGWPEGDLEEFVGHQRLAWQGQVNRTQFNKTVPKGVRPGSLTVPSVFFGCATRSNKRKTKFG